MRPVHAPVRTRFARAIAEVKPDARTAGPTDADIDAELAAYNAEHCDRGALD
jgi:hypothetical protein